MLMRTLWIKVSLFKIMQSDLGSTLLPFLLNKILLTHYQTTNFKLVQIETVCRRVLNLMKKAECSQTREKKLEKGEIARYEQFLLFPQCFLKACSGASKGVIVWEWVKNSALKLQ